MSKVVANIETLVKEYKKHVQDADALTDIITDICSKFQDITQTQLEIILQAEIIEDLCEQIELDSYPKLQYQTAKLLTLIAEKSVKATNVMIENGAADSFIRLLEVAKCNLLLEQCVIACGVMSDGHSEDRDYLIDAGIVEPLSMVLDKTIYELRDEQIKLKMEAGQKQKNLFPSSYYVKYENCLHLLKCGVTTMSNLCRGIQPPVDYESVEQFLKVVQKVLLFIHDPVVINDSCWCILYLCEGLEERIDDVLNLGIGPMLINLLKHNITENVLSGAMTLGCMFTGTEEQLQLFIDEGVLLLFKKHLSSKRKSIRLECCKAIARYVETCNVEQIQSLIEADIYPEMIELIVRGWSIARSEATSVVSRTTTKCNLDQINHLVECGSIKALCDLIHNGGNRLNKLVLIALDNILRVNDKQLSEGPSKENIREYKSIFKISGGVEELKFLKATKTNGLHRRACSMLIKYFPDEFDG